MQAAPARRSTPSNAVAILIAVVGIAAFAGLLPASRWQVDEYLTGTIFRDQGFAALWERVTTWSPRFLSEIGLYFYQSWVNSTGTPHILIFMLLLWGLFLASIILPAAYARDRSRWITLSVSLTLAFLCIAGQRNSEVLYWLQAAIAYLPSISGLILASMTILTADMDERAPRVTVATALTVAALTSEAGAFMVGAISGLFFVYSVAERLFTLRQPAFRALTFFVPLVATAVVMLFLAGGRLGTNAEVIGDPAVAHNVLASLKMTVSIFPLQYFLFGNNVLSGAFPAAGALTKTMFFLGALAAFTCIPNRRGAFIAGAMIGVAGVAAAFISMGGSIFQFGVHCCERHTTMEQVYIWISITGFARAISSLVQGKSDIIPRISAPALAIASLVPLSLLSPSLMTNYARLPEIRAKQLDVWHSGSSDAPEIIIRKFEPAPITQGGFPEFPSGEYTNVPETGWYQRILMDYFKKDRLLVVQEHQP